MGTVIEATSLRHAGLRSRHSALRLAVAATNECLDHAGRPARDIDLLVNVGLYRDRNLGEPALAALIQEDVGANPEDPHPDGHGTFSFDIANGVCGPLTALQIADGFLHAGTIRHAAVVASDADPGRGLSVDFPFAAIGAALLCSWAPDDTGLGPVSWAGFPDDGETFRATVGYRNERSLLEIASSPALDETYAVAAAKVARDCIDRAEIDLASVDRIVAAPARPEFAAHLADHLGVGRERISLAPDEGTHTAALIAALHAARLEPGSLALLVAAGAGVTAGAALYRNPG